MEIVDLYALIFQNKRVLTISHDPEDRETVHVEFDLTGSGLIWTSGKLLLLLLSNTTMLAYRNNITGYILS